MYHSDDTNLELQVFQWRLLQEYQLWLLLHLQITPRLLQGANILKRMQESSESDWVCRMCWLTWRYLQCFNLVHLLKHFNVVWQRKTLHLQWLQYEQCYELLYLFPWCVWKLTLESHLRMVVCPSETRTDRLPRPTSRRQHLQKQSIFHNSS